MEEQKVTKPLNKLLQGQYMGIHSYEEFIKNLDDASPLRSRFIMIQKDLKHHAELLSERIQELHGTPATSEGVIGKIEQFISLIFDHPQGEKDILKHAIKGENLYGIKMTEKLVRDKLDEKSMSLVHQILDKQKEHVDYLKSELH
ncbi:PA2169 family four-helix-bundle protein [Cytobacillus firmus]|nr:PA2169 family four-helix-bundle protein [Cytobacillus firmus]